MPLRDPTKTFIYMKKKNVHISKSLSIVKNWNILGPMVVDQIGGAEYSHIPYLVDASAYEIGHIFVQEPTDIQCFCAAPMHKILGPIRDFIKDDKSDPTWSSADFNAIKSTKDCEHFIVGIKNETNVLKFRAMNYFLLDKKTDMSVEGHVTIDRSSHEDLSRAEWFGLITGVIAAHTWDIRVRKDQSERTFQVGEKPHTILFKYDICRMNNEGAVQETSSEKMECKWLPVQDRNLDSLPLSKFVSQSSKVSRK